MDIHLFSPKTVSSLEKYKRKSALLEKSEKEIATKL